MNIIDFQVGSLYQVYSAYDYLFAYNGSKKVEIPLGGIFMCLELNNPHFPSAVKILYNGNICLLYKSSLKVNRISKEKKWV